MPRNFQTGSKTRVAVLFKRLGPYHHARLNAAGRVLSVWGVETCGMEDIYAWEKVEGAAAFTRVTLMERNSGGRQWKQELHRKMWQALDDIKPQVVVVPGWSGADAFSALAWCIKTRTLAITMSESTVWDERRVAWKEWIKARLVKLCSAGLAGGTPHADYLAQLGLPRDRIFLGYDIVDNDHFAARAAEIRNQKSEIKNIFQLSEFQLSAFQNTPFFLASARFVEKKNLSRLIEAYARYRELATNHGPPTSDLSSLGSSITVTNRFRYMVGRVTPCAPFGKPVAGSGAHGVTRPTCPDSVSKLVCRGTSSPVVPWSLVLLGDGPLKSDLCHLISDLGLQHSVLLPGFKQYNELPTYYALAGAFIHASTTEQWGLVVNEAMASGLPVLVSNRCGCAQDLVQDGVNGFTFDPYNVEQLAQLMLRISDLSSPPRSGRGCGEVSNDSQLSTMGSESQRIISHWGPDRFADGLPQAVKVAMSVPQPKASVLDRLLLKLLLMR